MGYNMFSKCIASIKKNSWLSWCRCKFFRWDILVFETRTTTGTTPIVAVFKPTFSTPLFRNWWKLAYLEPVTDMKGTSILVFLFRWMRFEKPVEGNWNAQKTCCLHKTFEIINNSNILLFSAFYPFLAIYDYLSSEMRLNWLISRM